MIKIAALLLALGIVFWKIEAISDVIHRGKVWIYELVVPQREHKQQRETLGNAGYEPMQKKSDEWYSEPFLIAHAAGGIDGKAYMNCMEGMQHSVEAEYSVVELDMCLTSDGQIAIRHNWDNPVYENAVYGEEEIPDFDEYYATPVCYKYHAMSFTDVLDILRDNPELYVMTDCKITEMAPKIVESVMNYGVPELLERFIIQIYNESDYDRVREIYPFQHFVYTLYLLENPDYVRVVAFCLEKGIPVVTVSADRYADDDNVGLLQEYGITVLVHTVNTITEAGALFKNGVGGIYTDFLLPADMKHMLGEEF